MSASFSGLLLIVERYSERKIGRRIPEESKHFKGYTVVEESFKNELTQNIRPSISANVDFPEPLTPVTK